MMTNKLVSVLLFVLALAVVCIESTGKTNSWNLAIIICGMLVAALAAICHFANNHESENTISVLLVAVALSAGTYALGTGEMMPIASIVLSVLLAVQLTKRLAHSNVGGVQSSQH